MPCHGRHHGYSDPKPYALDAPPNHTPPIAGIITFLIAVRSLVQGAALFGRQDRARSLVGMLRFVTRLISRP
jgi:hypothetical protein